MRAFLVGSRRTLLVLGLFIGFQFRDGLLDHAPACSRVGWKNQVLFVNSSNTLDCGIYSVSIVSCDNKDNSLCLSKVVELCEHTGCHELKHAVLPRIPR